MEIDLFTVVAQIVNFIILLLLLKYLLYGRIIKAMDEREEMIASRLKEAEKEKSEALAKHRDLVQKEEELDQQRELKLSRAAEEAESTKKAMLDAARQDVEEAKKRWHVSVGRQRSSFLRELRLRAGEEVYAVARRALKDLADADLERLIAHAFIARLNELPDARREEIARLNLDSDEGIAVYSSFSLAEETKGAVLAALRTQLGEDLEVSFRISPELICGIELRAGDRTISWNLNNYMSTLEDNVSLALEEAGTGEG